MAQISIRCINPKTNKVKNLFPNVANNAQLMRNMGWVIADPQYDAKMDAIKNNKPFSENGKTEQPLKESFISPAPVQEEVKKENVEDPKLEAKKRGRPRKLQ